MTTDTLKPPAKPAGMKARVLRAGSWSLGGQAIAQVMRLATNIVTARLLFPDAFGLMAVVNMLITALALFSDLGISRSVVMSARGNEPALLNTAWTIQFIRSIGLTAATLAAGAGIAIAAHFGLFKGGTVYADPRLPPLLGVFSLVLVLQGLESIRVIQARRQMHLHTLTKIDLVGQLASALAMLAVAYTWHSVWALVAGAVTSSIVKTSLGYLTLPGHTVKIGIDKSSAAELMGHAKWIFLSSILGFMALNGDRVLLGGLISSHDFGLYSIALLLATVLQGVANSLCNSIAFPALSEVFRERPAQLPKTFEKFQWGYDVLVVFPAAVLMTAGSAVVDVMYDARYHDAGWMLAVLSLGLVGVRYQPVEVGYLAVGKPKYATIANFLRLSALAAGLFVGSHFWGLPGAIGGVALSQYAAWPVAIWFKARTHSLTWRAEMALVPCLLAGLAVGELIAFLLRIALPHHFGH